jgi:hypothetical protein
MKRYTLILGTILAAVVLTLSTAAVAQAQDSLAPGGRWGSDGSAPTDAPARPRPPRGRGAWAGAHGARGEMNWQANLPARVEGEVPAVVADAMAAGLQDERNAYAIYEAVLEQFGNVRPFTNIQRAEAQHIAAWEFLFDRYELPLPAAEPLAEAPSFATVAEACQAAADAEIANFDLYDNMLATFEDYPDMVQVVTALRDASEFNHLPAFERCATR